MRTKVQEFAEKRLRYAQRYSFHSKDAEKPSVETDFENPGRKSTALCVLKRNAALCQTQT